MSETKEDNIQPGAKGVPKGRWRQLVILLVGVAVAVLYFGGYLRMPDPLEGTPARAFTLKSLDGKEVKLADYVGKNVILLDFWAAWCPPCRASIPALAEINKEYGPKGLVVYAVNQKDTPEAVRNFLKSANVDVPVLMDSSSVAGSLYGVTGIPKIVLIDRGGSITYVHSGYGPGAGWVIGREVRKALGQ